MAPLTDAARRPAGVAISSISIRSAAAFAGQCQPALSARTVALRVESSAPTEMMGRPAAMILYIRLGTEMPVIPGGKALIVAVAHDNRSARFPAGCRGRTPIFPASPAAACPHSLRADERR